MSSTSVTKQSTSASTISSLETQNIANGVTSTQNGLFTRAQFQNTMEGSRSVKSSKEVEQLLRDYPAALELYRTGRYKVKVKYEADAERVILVEKRSSKLKQNGEISTNGTQQNNQTQSVVSITMEKSKDDIKTEPNQEPVHNRTQSKDRNAPIVLSAPETSSSTKRTTLSTNTPRNSQVNNEKTETTLKDQEIPAASQTKNEQKQQKPKYHTTYRVNYLNNGIDNPSKLKTKGKRSSRDPQRAIVPYFGNGQKVHQVWPPSNIPQYYYSNPVLQQPTQPSNYYTPSTFARQKNPMFQQPYYHGQQSLLAISYQPPYDHSKSSKKKSPNSSDNSADSPVDKYSVKAHMPLDVAVTSTIPQSYPTYFPNQEVFNAAAAQQMYTSQMPYPRPTQWTTNAYNQPGSAFNTNFSVNGIPMKNERRSRYRALSVDMNSRHQSKNTPHNHSQLPPQAPATIMRHHHYHHRHHHRSQPATSAVNPLSRSVPTTKELNTHLNGSSMRPNNDMSNNDKLTIRQLHEIFIQMEPTGRLPYNSLPNILQRFGIESSENELATAARELQYNPAEPASARRLVHVLMKLGKITRSTSQQLPNNQQTMLPEDREVIDIMTQRRLSGAASTHIHSAVRPNRWY